MGAERRQQESLSAMGKKKSKKTTEKKKKGDVDMDLQVAAQGKRRRGGVEGVWGSWRKKEEWKNNRAGKGVWPAAWRHGYPPAV
ncbi:hypothetical protein Dda_1946 [Drechslerella dactyloides]|uniref:Uncharacterized protein n=1 Tax=Drechslerella dactyloides TaxID=74499 RepID=A0AAD6J2L4_DREDA|nr:hypothetical protein Dda_1946 [Drechslerella dactyloides]